MSYSLEIIACHRLIFVLSLSAKIEEKLYTALRPGVFVPRHDGCPVAPWHRASGEELSVFMQPNRELEIQPTALTF